MQEQFLPGLLALEQFRMACGVRREPLAVDRSPRRGAAEDEGGQGEEQLVHGVCRQQGEVEGGPPFADQA